MPVRPGPHKGCVPPLHIIGCPDWVPEGEQFEDEKDKPEEVVQVGDSDQGQAGEAH